MKRLRRNKPENDVQRYIDDVVARFNARLDLLAKDLDEVRRTHSSAESRVTRLEADLELLRQDWMLRELEIVQMLRSGKVPA